MRIKIFISFLIISILFFALQPGAAASSKEDEDYEVIVIEEELDKEELAEVIEEIEIELNGELELLRDPFAYYGLAELEKMLEEAAAEEEQKEERARNVEPVRTVSEPSFTVTGALQRGGDMVILVRNGASVEMIRTGEEIDGYKLVRWQNRKAVFEKHGQSFNLSPQ